MTDADMNRMILAAFERVESRGVTLNMLRWTKALLDDAFDAVEIDAKSTAVSRIERSRNMLRAEITRLVQEIEAGK